MEVYEYGCPDCRSTFKKIDQDEAKAEKEVKCPRCGSGNVEKFKSPMDKFRFYTLFAFGGG